MLFAEVVEMALSTQAVGVWGESGLRLAAKAKPASYQHAGIGAPDQNRGSEIKVRLRRALFAHLCVDACTAS